MPASLRRCVPCCTTTPYFFWASTAIRPSAMSCDSGFSTYTCLPACAPMIVIGACQWFGVAIEIASIVLSSSTRRKSRSPFVVSGLSPASLARFASVRSSTV